jgi:hypothetical protein
MSGRVWLFVPWSLANALHRRKIRLIESNAECRYLKKITSKGEAPSPPMTRKVRGGEGGEELNREKVRGAIVHKTGQKYEHD